ncbi:hypothetical protein E0I61_00120 [Flavobacterium ranwuense]|uniref:Uncharacterized protein n=1 Tax=Flavobacterium ranwuense TaxID=2541725 RepID=A0ABY2DTW0_9FLAO|nr:hypothetical protein [Flavobacterium ranwuense]TDE31143.1 hypothetical protein E0I61_00120 [Flavobacterium ranwuense]
MFEKGNLFYFKDYIFKNGNPPKNKFFLVLKTIENGFIAAILPTKVESLPSTIEKNHGCISFPEKCICCYYIPKDIPVTDNGFSFQLDTFLYAQHVFDETETNLFSTYQIEDIEFKGKLIEGEFEKIIQCFSNSILLPRKFRKDQFKL